MSSSIIKIKGLPKVKNLLFSLPKKLDKEVTITSHNFMRAVRKSAKMRAPVDTGSLKADIKLMPMAKKGKEKRWKLVVDNPAAAPQEFGFKPHFAPILNSSKMIPGVYFVSKNTPFIKPALQHNLGMLQQRLIQSVRRSII